MLPRVLLHVIEASLPVDRAGDFARAAWYAVLQHVRDAIPLVDDVGDDAATEHAEVIRLPPRRGVERGAVEIHTTPVVGDVDDTCIEARDVGIRVVQPCCAHGARSRLMINMSRQPSNQSDATVWRTFDQREWVAG